MSRYAVVDSPVGPLTLVGDGDAVVGLYFEGPGPLPVAARAGTRDDTALPALREQLAAYFAGDLTEFDVPLAPTGTPFQLRVWLALRAVPYGGTCTYGDIAAAVGRPTAVRAVGAANGRNPISIVVPCHRVVGAAGALTGYGGGLARKRALLDLESGSALPYAP